MEDDTKAVIAFGTLAVGLITLGAVAAYWEANREPEYAAYCAREDTQVRVDDDKCGEVHDSPGGGLTWIYVPMDSHAAVPAVGSRGTFKQAVRKVPADTPVAKGLPSKGGSSMVSIARGGFGANAKASTGSSGS